MLAVAHVASSLDRVSTSKFVIGVMDSDHSTSTMVGVAPMPIEGMKALLVGKSREQSSQRSAPAPGIDCQFPLLRSFDILVRTLLPGTSVCPFVSSCGCHPQHQVCLPVSIAHVYDCPVLMLCRKKRKEQDLQKVKRLDGNDGHRIRSVKVRTHHPATGSSPRHGCLDTLDRLEGSVPWDAQSWVIVAPTPSVLVSVNSTCLTVSETYRL